MTARRSVKLPTLARGDGSWGYDAARGQTTLRHRWQGKPYIERGDSPAECIVRRDRRRRDADVRSTLAGDGTFGGLLAAWLEFRSEGRSASTVEAYAWSIGHLRRHLGADTLVTELAVGEVEIMYATLTRGGLSAASLVKLRSHLSMALDFGLRRGLIPAEIRERLRTAVRPDVAPVEVEKRWYGLADFETVRGHLLHNRHPRNALFLTMLLCGLRPGEAMGLKWEHVDLERRVLRVEGAIDRHAGGYTTVLKTDHRHRFAHRAIPIPGELRLVLDDMRRAARPGDEFVFVEVDGRTLGEVVSPAVVERHAMIIATEVRVPHVNPNGYRHTFASVCRHHGMPYEQLAKLMGHRDATMIIKTYGHPIVAPTALDLDRYLGNPEAVTS